MSKRRKLRFLSESVLLEESGLPMINKVTIITVVVIITCFIFWASQSTITDELSLTGVVLNSETGHHFVGLGDVEAKIEVKVGDDVQINLIGITSKQKIRGKVIEIEPMKNPPEGSDYLVMIIVEAVNNDLVYKSIKADLIEGMDLSMEVVVAERTLIQYILGSFYDTASNDN